MAADNTDYTGRKPRHQVADPNAVAVRLTRAGDGDAHATAVELLDFARSGVRLRFAEGPGSGTFSAGERVVVQLTTENSRLDFSLPAVVRWQRADGPGFWLLGCEFKDEVTLEMLGELFLNEILSDGNSSPASAER